MSEHPTISCAEDGPYLVKGLEHFSNSRHDPIEPKPTMALCRCGGSANKPYCDGTHTRIGFTGAKAEDRTPDRLDTYEGEHLTVRDNRGTCCHAGECTRGAPEVWRMRQKPWIAPDEAGADRVREIIHKCPSGALTIAGEGEGETSPPAIRIEKDGPYHVRGAVALEGVAWGEGAAQDRYALCRCGQSRNKPFCDGTHSKVGFSDPDN